MAVMVEQAAWGETGVIHGLAAASAALESLVGSGAVGSDAVGSGAVGSGAVESGASPSSVGSSTVGSGAVGSGIAPSVGLGAKGSSLGAAPAATGPVADLALWMAGDSEVVDALATVGRLRQALDVIEVGLVAEGVGRGLPSEGSWSVADWVCRAEGRDAPSPPMARVLQVVRLATCERVPAVREAFERGDLSLGKADQLVRFDAEVARVADPDQLAADVDLLLAAARDDVVSAGPQERPERVPGLGERDLRVAITRTGRLLRPSRELEREERVGVSGRGLFSSRGPAGMTSYRLVLDAEGAAVIDAAVAGLSGPVTGPDGERDPRSAAHRRADAVVEVVRRGVSAPGEVARCDKAQVVVTIPLEALREGCDGAGVTGTGQVVSPSVVRRLACDAGIVPAVLGSRGEVVELGRVARLFTPGQRRVLWHRDRGCTYPGCSMPAQWCDAHHVRWWSRGGRTDVGNAALLCQRHHSLVHSRDLGATVTATGVTWHL